MPNFKYAAEVLELKEIHEMPGAWTPDDYLGLLNHIEYDDPTAIDAIPQEELQEMACMALSDFTLEDAAVKVLEFRLGETLNKGQRQNLAEEFKEERLWEEYSDIALHEELFNIACVLYWTFPRQFSTPDIARLKVIVRSLNKDSMVNLLKPTESFLTRLLNDGMDGHNIIRRLFADNIKSNSFPESEHIIWKFEESGFSAENTSSTFTIYTSCNWVDGLKRVKDYESTAFADGQL